MGDFLIYSGNGLWQRRSTTEDAVCEAAPKAGHRELLFSVSSVLSVVFQNIGSQKIIKSLRLVGTLFK